MSGEIERLVAAINDHPDLLHGDRTPAVEALVQHGVDALPHVLPLLVQGDKITRLRAQRVLEGVTLAWTRGTTATPARSLTQGGGQDWHLLWQENGAYDWRAPAAAREEAVRLWRAWLEKIATRD